MTRDQEQFRLPKLPFVFDFAVNENWQEAYEQCKQDERFRSELSDIEEDLKTIVQSIGIIFTDCSATKLCFLSKAYMIFVHLLDSSDWDNYEDVDSKVDYLKQCYSAFQKRDLSQLKELSPYFYKLSELFESYEIEQQTVGSTDGDDEQQYSVDGLMKSLIDSLNEIMLKSETEHEELHCSMHSLTVEERANSYLSHNVNHYDVLLGKLFFNQQMISDEIERDSNYKELRHTMSKAIGLINEIYSFPMEIKLYQQLEMNFIIKLVEWFKISIPQALQLAPDYVDELLQRFDCLSKRLLDTHSNSTKIHNYIDFWKKMYLAAILFCTQTSRYSRFFAHPIKYKFLEKFNIK